MANNTNISQADMINAMNEDEGGMMNVTQAQPEVIDLTGDDDAIETPKNNAVSRIAGAERTRTSIYPGSRNSNLLVQQLRLHAPQAAPTTTRKRIRKPKLQPPMVKSGPELKKFHPFPRLPIELRLRIWKQAIRVPAKLRVVIKWIPMWQRIFPFPINPDQCAHPIIFRAIPVMSVGDSRGTSFACKESYIESKKVLKNRLEVFNGFSGRIVYNYDADLDTIVMNCPAIFALNLCGLRMRVDNFVGATNWVWEQILDYHYTPYRGFDKIQRLLVEDVAYGNAGSVPQLLEKFVRHHMTNLKVLKLNPGWPDNFEMVTDSVQKNFTDRLMAMPVGALPADFSTLTMTSLWIRKFLKDCLKFDSIADLKGGKLEVLATVCGRNVYNVAVQE